MNRILVITRYTRHIAFARLAKYCLSAIEKEGEIYHLGIDYFRSRVTDKKAKVRLYPSINKEGAIENDELKLLIDEIKPTVIFIIQDVSFQKAYIESLAFLKKDNFKIVVYLHLESKLRSGAPLSYLKHVDKIVCCTAFGKQVIQDLKIRDEEGELIDNRIEVIPHGVNTILD